MPRPLSGNALNALMAQRTDEAFILLVEFLHEDSGETYRAALNTEDVTSDGHVYTASYFDFSMPEEGGRAPQGCQITVDNVDRLLIGLLREITQPLKVKVRLVLASSPNVVEMELTDLVMREVQWDASKITGTLVSDDPLNQVFPAHVYDPRSFQGIF